MKGLIFAVILTLIASVAFAGTYTVTLSKDQEDSLRAYWETADLQSAIQKTIAVIADDSLISAVDKKWGRLTYEQKKQLIPNQEEI